MRSIDPLQRLRPDSDVTDSNIDIEHPVPLDLPATSALGLTGYFKLCGPR